MIVSLGYWGSVPFGHLMVIWEYNDPSWSLFIFVFLTVKAYLLISVCWIGKRLCLLLWWLILCFSALVKYKGHRAKPANSRKIFTVFEPISYTACSWNSMYTFSTRCVFLLIILFAYYLWIWCSYMCLWVYLVFPSVYSVLEYHWIY